MRVVGWVVLVMMLPGQALATPEPPPPGDYPGSQYIDRTGCVFLRDGNTWMPRLDGQGTPICGFPPSQPATVAAAEPPSPEAVLTDILAQGLRPGDLATDPSPQPPAQVEPAPAQAELDGQLSTQIELDARLRSALTAPAPEGLCARLGYRPDPQAAPVIGTDVTQGLCPGMTAIAPESRIAAATVVAGAVARNDPPKAAKAVTPAAAAGRPRPEPSQRAVAAAPESRSVVARRPAAEPAPKGSLAEMIPPHARYVQIGVYQDEANALAALRRLSAMGYRTAQRREGAEGAERRAILAGPFADRQAIVSALTRLRSNGYPRAEAR